MKQYSKQFLGVDDTFTCYEKSRTVIVPVPYEGGISNLSGAAEAPDAVLDASQQLELYDEVLREEPYRTGISTIVPPFLGDSPESMIERVQEIVEKLSDDSKFVVVLGGDHSVTTGCFRVLHSRNPSLGVIQLDAHADLRDSYNGSRYSHACTMARIREVTEATLQLGIRSLSIEEARLVESENLSLYTMHDIRTGAVNVRQALDRLPEDIYLTVDVDAFDWSVIRSTGTPEPGGFFWDEGVELLQNIFARKNVIGVDVVELAPRGDDFNSSFAVAKLIYKMVGLKFRHQI